MSHDSTHWSPTARRLTIGVAALVAVAASVAVTAAVSADGGATRATATLQDVNGNVVGFAKVVEDDDGVVSLNVKVAGLTPGLHGIHVHTTGSCVGPAFTSAGGHFNPGGTVHGYNAVGGPHAGDLPNMTVNEAGRGTLNASTTALTMSAGTLSALDADGGAIVIHAAPDDYVTNPAGNSLARIVCGVLEAAG
jgi:superoxide dismutase, Cu-Zn family